MENVMKNLAFEWKTISADLQGIAQYIVSDSLDENKKTGRRTRFVRYDPGARTGVFVHDYHEEVYVIDGSQFQLDPSGLRIEYAPKDFIQRPPGTEHGPFESNNGCVLLEVHYYD